MTGQNEGQKFYRPKLLITQPEIVRFRTNLLQSTDYDHVTHNVPETFKIKGSKVNVTYLQQKNAIG